MAAETLPEQPDTTIVSRKLLRLQANRLCQSVLKCVHDAAIADQKDDLEFLMDSMISSLDDISGELRGSSQDVFIDEYRRRILRDHSARFQVCSDSLNCIRRNICFFGLDLQRCQSLLRWLSDFRNVDQMSTV